MNKRSSRLYFEDDRDPRDSSKLTHSAKELYVELLPSSVHASQETDENNEDDISTDIARTAENATESGVRVMDSAHHSQHGKRSRDAETPSKAKQQQKRQIKKEYASAKTSHYGDNAASSTGIAADNRKKWKRKTKRFIEQNKKGIWVIGILAIMVVFLINIASSCSVLVQGGISAVGSTTYPSADSDMRDAEAAYCGMETELEEYLDDYERNHDYDEYHYELDEIEHDPYVLISAITALHGDAWTIDEVSDIIQTLFDHQYIVRETVTEEVHYETVVETGTRQAVDPETGLGLYDEDGEPIMEEFEYLVHIPHSYFICYVTLENFNLSHVPVYIMSRSQLSMYAMYMGTLGNRPDLFPLSGYVARYYLTEYEVYEIPEEALEDKQFAAMIEEAEKYLGYPYVWGGSHPSTSFDCSGFVSWVLNNCGVGWNVGRLGADSLRGCCTTISADEARPGDLIFFQGTYDTPGASHVCIYVGEDMMIHCGDPIQYSSIDTSYFREHFMCFGRLPPP